MILPIPLVASHFNTDTICPRSRTSRLAHAVKTNLRAPRPGKVDMQSPASHGGINQLQANRIQNQRPRRSLGAVDGQLVRSGRQVSLRYLRDADEFPAVHHEPIDVAACAVDADIPHAAAIGQAAQMDASLLVGTNVGCRSGSSQMPATPDKNASYQPVALQPNQHVVLDIQSWSKSLYALNASTDV